MLNVNSIVWSENCVDPGCRVFFVGSRIFRAYEESRKQEVMDFLNSECYSILTKRRQIVNTWITEEIQLEGYPVILEHERLCCMPEKWLCFEMLKDILSFHFEVNELCKHYGFCVRDIGFGNVTLNKGQLCFIDFGSFRKIDNSDSSVFSQHCLPLAYLPLSMYCRNDGNDFVADSMIGDYDRWVTAQKNPYGDTLFKDLLQPYLHSIVSYYRIQIVRTPVKLRVYTAFSVACIKRINRFLKSFLPPKYLCKNIIEISPLYSEGKAKKSVRKLEFPYKGESLYPVENCRLLQNIHEIISERIDHPVKRIILWGNFVYDEVRLLRNTIDCELLVMSSDRLYTNWLYKKIRHGEDDISVICCNAMRGKDFKLFGALKTDVLILQSNVYLQVHNGTHSDWPEKASYYASYILTSDVDEGERKISHFNSFYELLYANDELGYQLFGRK